MITVEAKRSCLPLKCRETLSRDKKRRQKGGQRPRDPGAELRPRAVLGRSSRSGLQPGRPASDRKIPERGQTQDVPVNASKC